MFGEIVPSGSPSSTSIRESAELESIRKTEKGRTHAAAVPVSPDFRNARRFFTRHLGSGKKHGSRPLLCQTWHFGPVLRTPASDVACRPRINFPVYGDFGLGLALH